MRILAARHGLPKLGRPSRPARRLPRGHVAGRCFPRLRRPFRGTEDLREFDVTRICRQRRRKIDPVPIDVNIVFIDPALPCEPVRIDGVNRQHARIGGKKLEFLAAQPIHLSARTAIALDAMRARDLNEDT